MSKLTHLCLIYFLILIDWTSPFPILGLLGGIFHFYSNFKRNFCKQTGENLIRRRVLWRLVWFCTVCRFPTKRTLGLYGLRLYLHVPNYRMLAQVSVFDTASIKRSSKTVAAWQHSRVNVVSILNQFGCLAVLQIKW